MRKGFETASVDIKKEFSFLKDFGFIISGEIIQPHKTSIGYTGSRFNILLSYEFMEENFDFSLISVNDTSKYRQLWKVISEINPDFDYRLAKPGLSAYKDQLAYLASSFRRVLPFVIKMG